MSVIVIPYQCLPNPKQPLTRIQNLLWFRLMNIHAKFFIARKGLNRIASSQNDIVAAELFNGSSSRRRVFDKFFERGAIANSLIRFRVQLFYQGWLGMEKFLAFATIFASLVLLLLLLLIHYCGIGNFTTGVLAVSIKDTDGAFVLRHSCLRW